MRQPSSSLRLTLDTVNVLKAYQIQPPLPQMLTGQVLQAGGAYIDLSYSVAVSCNPLQPLPPPLFPLQTARPHPLLFPGDPSLFFPA